MSSPLGQRELRKRAKKVDYAALEELGVEETLLPLGEEGRRGRTNKWVEYLSEREFGAAETLVQWLEDGESLTLEWVRRTGLQRPTVVRNKKGLGLTVPSGMSVAEVAKICGHETPVQVVDTGDQSEVSGWSLGDWAGYWSGRRTRVLNVISLEISRLPLMSRVRSPSLVRRLDWIDSAWPEALRVRGEYPQTQYYCLMSPENAWTDFHVDFGGTAVWYHVVSGKKVFYLAAPTVERLAVYERWICDPNQGETFFADLLPDEATVRLELKAGQTLLIPSGWIHAVHTPEDSLVFGGNFLPGLTTLGDQLRVHSLESRAKVASKFRFPFFVSAMFFGLSVTHRRISANGYDSLSKLEQAGLDELVQACAVWIKGLENALAGPAAVRAAHARLAASEAGFPTPSALINAFSSLHPTRPKLTLKLMPKSRAVVSQDDAEDDDDDDDDENDDPRRDTLSPHDRPRQPIKLKISSAWLEPRAPEPPQAAATSVDDDEDEEDDDPPVVAPTFPPPQGDVRTKKRPAPQRPPRPVASAAPSNTAISRLKQKLAKRKR